MFDVAALIRHWKSSPPIHITFGGIAKAFSGGRGGRSESSPAQSRTKTMSDADMEQQRMFLQGVANQFGSVRQGASAL